MSKTDSEIVNDCLNRFIDLANSLKEEGIEPSFVSHALMCASCVYTTYAMAGNEGTLSPQSMEQVVAVYQRELAKINEAKKNNELS